MECSERRDDGVLILAPNGRIDSKTAKDFETQLLGRIETGEPAVLVDCSALEFISSAGLRVLLMAAKRRRQPATGSACSPSARASSRCWR